VDGKLEPDGMEEELEGVEEGFSDIIGLPPPRSIGEDEELEPPLFSPAEPRLAASTSGSAQAATKRSTNTPIPNFRPIDCLIVMSHHRLLPPWDPSNRNSLKCFDAVADEKIRGSSKRGNNGVRRESIQFQMDEVVGQAFQPAIIDILTRKAGIPWNRGTAPQERSMPSKD